MSTNARIGVIRSKDASGEPATVESIYLHWDGYPEGAGTLLLDHWTDAAKVDELISVGDLSALGAEIGEAHDFDAHRGNDVCLFYGRDRGEDGVGSVTHAYGEWPDYGQEFEYLFTAVGWVYRTSSYGTPSGDTWHILDREAVAA
jgi:hypothetical protein